MEKLTEKILKEIRSYYHQDVDIESANNINRVIKETIWNLTTKQGKKTAVSEAVIIKYLSTKDYNYYYFVFDAVRFVYNGITYYEIGTSYYHGMDEETATSIYNSVK